MARFIPAPVAGALLAVTVAALPATASGAPKPRITAHPSSVMVLNTTTLAGRHFPSKSKITIEECSETSWIAPNQPCDSSNAVKVKTDAKGRFSAVMTVQTCPGSGAGSSPPGFSERCYVGEPVGTGVDTLALEGAATITVTGP